MNNKHFDVSIDFSPSIPQNFKECWIDFIRKLEHDCGIFPDLLR